jgi:hypothetical protein
MTNFVAIETRFTSFERRKASRAFRDAFSVMILNERRTQRRNKKTMIIYHESIGRTFINAGTVKREVSTRDALRLIVVVTASDAFIITTNVAART